MEETEFKLGEVRLTDSQTILSEDSRRKNRVLDRGKKEDQRRGGKRTSIQGGDVLFS